MTDARIYDFERARRLRDELAQIKANDQDTMTMVTGGIEFRYTTSHTVGESINGQLPLPLTFSLGNADGATA